MTSRILAVPLVTQYEAPFCFYASTSMVLSYFGIQKSVSEIVYEVALDHPGDYIDAFLGEYVAAIKDYLSDYGLEVHFYRDKDWDGIKRHIDSGHPLIAGVKALSTHNRPNHAWVIRGYDESNGRQIIYNNPWEDPGSQDPTTYDPDGDGVPGDTIEYDRFVDDHWASPLPITNQTYIAISYKGQGAGKDYLDWRGAAMNNYGRWYYHMSRMTRKFYALEIGEFIVESLISAVAFVGLVVGGVQIFGQLLEKAGHWLIDEGKERWNKGGIGGKALGAALIVAGGVVAGIGYVLDAVGGVAGLGVDLITSTLDAIGSAFTGSRGGSDSTTIGETNLDTGLNLSVWPWESRWGDNWEKISGSFTVSVRDFSQVDNLQIWWSVNIWGWGIDSWSLRQSTQEVAGTVIEDGRGLDGSHHKSFYVSIDDAQGIRKTFGEDKCHYGRDGGMTRVNLKVEARATLNGERATVEKSLSVYGLSV